MSDTRAKIRELKKARNAVILAHTYQSGEVQDIADFVGDSYGLSVQASSTDADVIIFCGVQFMAETASILNPSKEVILHEPGAGCPMADMITAPELVALKEKYPSHQVMCYVNSTASIKALSDVCCTSSNAVKIARLLGADRGIIFVPDKHLGSFVEEQTGRPMVLWDGFCPTHVRILPEMIESAREAHPEAVVMIHPEAPRKCRALADEVLSTGGMLEFARKDLHQEFIVATETGLLHTLRKENPSRTFYALSDKITCPNMKLGSLQSVLRALDGTGGERIMVPGDIADRAQSSLRRMLEMSKA